MSEIIYPVKRSEVQELLIDDFIYLVKKLKLTTIETASGNENNIDAKAPIFEDIVTSLKYLECCPGLQEEFEILKNQAVTLALRELGYRTEAYHFAYKNGYHISELQDRDDLARAAFNFCSALKIPGRQIASAVLIYTPRKEIPKFIERYREIGLITQLEAEDFIQSYDL